MINDVRALQCDGAMQAAAASGLPVCLMHMQGTPATIQNCPQYTDLVAELLGFFKDRVQACIAQGMVMERLLIDPGFGFGKTLQHNLMLLNRLFDFHALGLPMLVGMSRKSMIGQVLNRPENERLAGSLALAVLAVERGASIIRVHDVKETADAVKMASAVLKVIQE
jgi:dihydropteroate synthase